jgi:RimJ/RimL family protein N-acetyltransferase
VTQEASNSFSDSYGFRVRVEPLTIQTVSRLRLSWSSRFDREDVARIVHENPGLSLWIPDTGEYVIGGPWRHRSEVAAVMEMTAQSGAVPLLQQLRIASAEAGKRLIIASEHHESRQKAFYLSAGYELIEEILIYELNRLNVGPASSSTLHFEPVDFRNKIVVRELIDLDHRSFPWLWWNSREEFDNYAGSFGVSIYLGRDDHDRAASYVGVTRFRNWGHLDRIAVDPELQGHGLGWESLDWSIRMLAESGARRIGLSTQARNVQSRRLYERYGFQRAPSQDYSLYGQWLESEESG